MTRMPSYQQAQVQKKVQEVVPLHCCLVVSGTSLAASSSLLFLPLHFPKIARKKLPKIGEYQIMDDHHHQTFWCHECDMSVSLLPLPTSFSRERERERDTLLCPHCFSDLLELMDSDSLQHDSLILQPPPHQPHPHSDNYLLNSPFLHRLIHHLSTHPINHDDLLPSATASSSSVPPSSLPASKASVDSIPTLKITSSMLDRDPLLLCAVCKEQFLHSVDAKQLPCNHLYHPHCILPWLSSHSSCPLCRFQLPTETQHHQLQLGHHTPLRFNFDNDDDEDLNDWFTEYGSSSSYGTSLRPNYISAGGRHMANQAHLGPAAAPNFNANANADSSFNGNL
nr:uncharacterized protein LOC103413575 [Malus domestica]